MRKVDVKNCFCLSRFGAKPVVGILLFPHINVSFCFIRHLFIGNMGWASGRAMAQVPLHLKLNPEKIQKAAKLKQEALAKHDSLLLAEAYYLYGKAYVFAGDYQTGQAYYVKAIRIHEPLGNSMELSRLYVRLSENEVRVGRLKQALHYATLSLKVAQATQKNKDKALIRAYGALAHVYGAIWGAEKPPNPSTFDRVISYYKKEEQLCYKLNDAPGIAEVNLELGTIFSQVNDPKAIPYLEKAQHLFTQLDKVTSLAFTMMHLAEAYLIFGKPKQAFQTLVKAEDLYNSKKLNNYEIRVDLAIQFVAYFETTRQWDKAFRRLRKLNELERIRLLADHDGALTRLSMEYETEKKKHS
ncbi:tetratricopeptide repeat protein [Spirosoma telluris]